METTSLSDLKAHLSEYADRAAKEHERFTVTRNGRPAVVLVAADDWEAMEETIFWLSQPGVRDDLAAAEADVETSRTFDEDEVRRALGLPRA